MFMMKRAGVGRTCVMSDDLVQIVEQQICERRSFTVSEVLCEFPQISRTLLYEIITSFVEDWFRKSSRVHTKRREWLRLRLFRAITLR
jgi:hypothetical protein